MTGLAPEIRAWMSDRTPAEKHAILGALASEYLSARETKPMVVQNQNADTVGYIVPGNSSASWPVTPERAAELRRRAVRPSEDSLTVEEFLKELKKE
jgi:hypothetical protein